MKLRKMLMLGTFLATSMGLQAQTATTNVGTNSGTLGTRNSFFGFEAGQNANSISQNNVVVGAHAAKAMTEGKANVAIGANALLSNETGTSNIGIGHNALRLNLGNSNIGIGTGTLRNNLTGTSNTAVGHQSLYTNRANNNTGYGAGSLSSHLVGDNNTGLGFRALDQSQGSSENTAVGSFALSSNLYGSRNVAIGYNSGVAPSAPIFAVYDNSIAIGTNAYYTASNQARIGNNTITSIGGYASWTNVSDARFKKNIKDDVQGLTFINKLRPVSYQLDRQVIGKFLGQSKEVLALTDEGEYQTGFLAQEVEKTVKDLGFTNFNGVDAPKNSQDHYGIRYAEFVVPLVKGVQELSTMQDEQDLKVEALESTVEELKTLVQTQQQQITALLAQSGTTSATGTIQGAVAQLGQNRPNPFSEATHISVVIPTSAGSAQLMVTNLEGKQIFLQQIEQRGKAEVTLAANSLTPGLYIYTLVVDNELVDSKKMMVVE